MQILITVPYKQITEQRMAYFMKSLICNKIVQVLEGFPIGGRGLRPSQFTCAVRICPKNGPAIEYDISLREHPSFSIPMEASAFVAKFPTDGTVQGAYIPDNEKDGKIVKLKVCNKKFLRETLNVVCDRPQNFWQSSPLLNAIQKKKIIVEFSSPNIAKPFHLGNLKSTIVGNFLSRMFEAVGHKVIRLNYLGDWGTQFGLLKHGYDAKNMSKKDLETQAIQKLCQLYIWANKEAEENPEVKEKAKDIFKRMELGDKDLLKTWQLFRDITIVELQDVYKKFNTYFDYYHGESMYNRDYCENIINMMIDKDILQSMPDGQKIYNRSANQKAITVVKSDGSTLYLTRDIAAAIHRHNSFNFDNMYYVVDSSQEEHFKSLINILNDLGYEWVKNITHVGFGRIHGMSTRKGTAVSLQDMLDEGVHLSLNHQKKSKYTPSDDSFNSHQTAENLVVSDLIAYCLNFKRSTQIPFSWKEVLQNGSGIGTRLQYIHCRLLRMEENCGIEFISDINEEHLSEPIVIDLIRLIARFDEALLSSYQSMESSAFLDYMTKLSNAASTTYRKLPVKSAPPSVAEARLKLFVAARLTLACGMKVLGIEPMQRM